MRRADRAVTDLHAIREILDSCKTCHLAMADGGQPYVLPLSYAYTLEDGVLTLFFHSAQEGRKLEILRKNSAVCFVISREGEPSFAAELPCNSGYYFASVHGFGQVEFLTDAKEKCAALTQLMCHQARLEIPFTPEQAERVCVYKVTADSFTGKAKPRPTR